MVDWLAVTRAHTRVAQLAARKVQQTDSVLVVLSGDKRVA